MKLFEIFQKLNEYNREYIVKNYSKKIEEILKKKNPEIVSLENFLDILEDHIEKNYDRNQKKILDPYIKWLVDRYSKNQIEDIEEIFRSLPILLRYSKLKNMKKIPTEFIDINKISDLKHLENIIKSVQDQLSKKEKKEKMELDLLKEKKAEIIYNDKDLKIVKINDFIASCFYGINTKWCTAMSDEENYEEGKSYFDYYISKGPLYVIIDKKNNKKYQISFAEKMLRDEKDEIVRVKDLMSLDQEIYFKILEVFREEIMKNNYVELLPPVYETLANEEVLKKIVDVTFFSINRKNYDVDPLEDLVEKTSYVYKFSKSKSNKILEDILSLIKEFIKKKEYRDRFNVHALAYSFPENLKREGVEIPEKFKKDLKKLLIWLSKRKFLPEIYFKNLEKI